MLKIIQALLSPETIILESDCKLWKRATDTDNYGHITRNGKDFYVHILAWELANQRRVPQNKQIHHLCHNTTCYNPEHLIAISPKQHQSIERAYRKAKSKVNRK